MGVRSIFVFTHDSIGLGEDGPTHQPIEQLAHLRAVPNLNVVRPGGRERDRAGVEVRHRAARHADRAGALAPGAAGLDPAGVPDDAIERGAYVLRDASRTDLPDLILMATGSEVHICTRAADLLEADGIATRVVSMPCLDRFAGRTPPTRDTVLPPGVRARVSVEAAATLGWDRWVGDAGEAIGMPASAPRPRPRRSTSTSGSCPNGSPTAHEPS